MRIFVIWRQKYKLPRKVPNFINYILHFAMERSDRAFEHRSRAQRDERRETRPDEPCEFASHRRSASGRPSRRWRLGAKQPRLATGAGALPQARKKKPKSHGFGRAVGGKPEPAKGPAAKSGKQPGTQRNVIGRRSGRGVSRER